MSVFHAEAAGDDAELDEAEAFVEMPRMGVGGDDGVELQHAEPDPFALHERIHDQFFADVQPAACR